MIIKPESIAGKFFINVLQSATQNMPVIRGKILGPVANELSPYYLCDLFPFDDYTPPCAQLVMSLDQICGMYLYTDETMFNAQWDAFSSQLKIGRGTIMRSPIEAMTRKMGGV